MTGRAVAGILLVTGMLAVGCGEPSQPADRVIPLVTQEQLKAAQDDFERYRAIGEPSGSERSDTAVRDSVRRALYCSLVEGHEFDPTQPLGMFTESGNQELAAQLESKIERLAPQVEGKTRDERILIVWPDYDPDHTSFAATDCNGAQITVPAPEPDDSAPSTRSG